jgi:hypothetical protein
MYYKLDENNNPIPCDIIEWAVRFEGKQDIVAYTVIKNIKISTVFLGFDHNTGPIGPPILWETMISNDLNSSEYQVRYTSYKDAVEGHLKAIQTVDPDYKLLTFPKIDLVKIYEEEQER